MQQNPMINEPPVTADDTNPSGISPLGQVAPIVTGRPPVNPLSRILGFALSTGAIVVTAAAALLYFQQSSVPAPTAPPPTVIIATRAPTVIPTQVPPSATPQDPNQSPAPDVLAELMAQPIDDGASNVLYRQQTAFTIAPPGPRSAPIEYKIQVGDTIEKIAAKFNISQDTIIWNNDVGYINRLEVGTPLAILPIDGILYMPSSEETIQQIADKFKVSPYAIIDSEYNKLQSATPSLLLPANSLQIMVPGGVSKKVAIYWKPTITTRTAIGGGSKGGGEISFGGGPGSCGYQSNGGGDGSLGYPVQGYTVVRSFSSFHSGIDLAKPTGSPVVAAGAGTVIFAGWSEWGYGYAIVIAHKPSLMTLYGHLSQIAVSCGQFVQRAAYIGAVGSTGNSTGPHLHFEIRENQVPVDPVSVMGGF